MSSKSQHSYDVIVLGVGCMGSAACLALAECGVRVLGLEQFAIPHARGSSHGESRIFRIAYYEHPNYVPLLVRARWAWLRIEADAERLLFLPTGGLWMGPAESELIAGSLRSSREHDLPHELLVPREIRARWNQFDVPESIVGFYEKAAGMLLPEQAIEAMVYLARIRGAEIRQESAVRAWRLDGSKIVVTTEHERFEAEHLIVCAGAWTSKVLQELPAPLRVTRQAMGWYDAAGGDPFAPRAMPCWARVRDEGGFFYGFPLAPGGRAIKTALHEVASFADPDQLSREAADAECAPLDQFMPEFFRGAIGPRTRATICLYTNSSDGHFIIDRPGRYDGRVTVACGFSGHGFKFAPGVGEALADLALEGTTRLPIEFLSMRRFRQPGVSG